jgi:uncharacterized protein (DUF2336 family)
VRQLVAETARGLDRIPKAVAFTLAKDREPDVAVPAISYPGHFDDEELIEIVRSAHDQRIVGAVAQRPRIGMRVSDAVVEFGDERSIGLLLGNGTAVIRADTMARVIERAPTIIAWHEPLARRPDLTPSAIARLVGFLSHALVDLLQGRAKSSTIPAESGVPAAAVEPVEPELLVPQEDPLSRARRLHAERRLTEDAIIEALGADQDFVIAALSLRGHLPPATVQKILAAHSAKGLTALAWKAGGTMRLALQLQTRIGRLPPKARLTAAAGQWPMTQDEMSWQIEFFESLVTGG